MSELTDFRTQEPMTLYQRLHLSLTLTGLIVAIGTLIFVGLQVRNLTEQAKRQEQAVLGQVWAAIGRENAEISKILVEHPVLLPYFHRSKPISPSDDNYDLVMAVADMYLDFFDSLFDQHIRDLPGMGHGGKYWILWDKYMQDTFATTPAVCARYEQVKAWYTSQLKHYAYPGCRTAPPTPPSQPNDSGSSPAQ